MAAALLLLTGLAGAQTPWGIECGDGRIDRLLDDFDTAWSPCCTSAPAVPMPQPRSIAGCRGQAMEVGFDLRNASADGNAWVVLQRSVAPALDLSRYTHLRLALRGGNPASHETLEIKLRGAGGTLHTAALRSVTDLPAWRAVYVDLREFVDPQGRTVDPSRIEGFEIGIARCRAGCEIPDNPSAGVPPADHQGSIAFDELAAVDLSPSGRHRLGQADFESATANPEVRAAAARAILARAVGSGPAAGLVPAWFDESTPNFNSYAQAEALLVMVAEYERSGQDAHRDAARRLAGRMIELQIPAGRAQAGAWFTAHELAGPRLQPRDGCSGDEREVPDLDRCQWVGNVGWMLVALGRLQQAGWHDAPQPLAQALERGVAWVRAQRGRTEGFPDITSLGIEGNVSATFGLQAAGATAEARALGEATVRAGFDPRQRRMKAGARPEDAAIAVDVAGSWGATLLRVLDRSPDALDSMAFALSTLRVRSFDGRVLGLGDIAGPFTPTVEFAAQAVAAGIGGAESLLRELDRLQRSDGSFPGAADAWYGGTLPPWNTTMSGVSPTAWMYFAHDRDPLLALRDPRVSLWVDRPSYRRGERISLSGRTRPGLSARRVDVWVSLRPPGCSTAGCELYWLGGQRFSSTPAPVLRDWPVSAFDGPVFEWTFDGSEPPGEYQWTARFTEPGTTRPVGDPSRPRFSVLH